MASFWKTTFHAPVKFSEARQSQGALPRHFGLGLTGLIPAGTCNKTVGRRPLVCDPHVVPRNLWTVSNLNAKLRHRTNRRRAGGIRSLWLMGRHTSERLRWLSEESRHRFRIPEPLTSSLSIAVLSMLELEYSCPPQFPRRKNTERESVRL
jgi:hypothetical protein